MKILAVEDEKDTQRLLRRLLTGAGHEVAIASSAIEAMILVKCERFDVILLDIMLPGIDGHQLAQTLTGSWDTFDIPIIVVSCLTDAHDKSWARINGCARYIEKPFSPGELLEAIDEIGRGQTEQVGVPR